MIISHSKQFVVLATWKAASSTLHARLRAYNDSPYSRWYHYNETLQRVVHGHITSADFLALPESRLGYRSAAFVRNPYDRVYAGFRQIVKDVQEQPYSVFPSSWVRDLVMRQLAENYAQLSEVSFNFDRWVKCLRKSQIYDIGRNTSFSLHPAKYWTHVGARQVVDFVGRVENFEADFDAMCAMLEIDGSKNRVNDNVKEPLGEADPNGYRYAARMKGGSIDKINDLFAEDFEAFGYPQIPSRSRC